MNCYGYKRYKGTVMQTTLRKSGGGGEGVPYQNMVDSSGRKI